MTIQQAYTDSLAHTSDSLSVADEAWQSVAQPVAVDTTTSSIVDSLARYAVVEPDEAPCDSLVAALLHFQEPDGGYFSTQPFWHPDMPLRTVGISTRPLPYRVSDDSYASCALLLCFLMLLYMLLRYGNEMRSQMHDFFLPARIRQGHMQGMSTAQGLLSMPYLCLVLSVMGSVGLSVLEQDSLDTLIDARARLAMQGIYALVWLLYFLCKVRCYAFVNWIFFNSSACREWRETLFLVLACEGILMFPIVLLLVYQPSCAQIAVWCAFSIIALSRVLLLYKAKTLFYVKVYGALHLFVYFCTLEVAPLWVVLKILTRLTDYCK